MSAAARIRLRSSLQSFVAEKLKIALKCGNLGRFLGHVSFCRPKKGGGSPGTATVQGRGHCAWQQDGPHRLGVVGQWRALPDATACGGVRKDLAKGG
jgi:hypothetical protein